MGKKYSGVRPEDQPVFTNPVGLDFEKRRIFVPIMAGSPTPHPSIGMQQHGNEWHSPDFIAIGYMYLDAGLVTAEIATYNTRVAFDLGGI